MYVDVMVILRGIYYFFDDDLDSDNYSESSLLIEDFEIIECCWKEYEVEKGKDDDREEDDDKKRRYC